MCTERTRFAATEIDGNVPLMLGRVGSVKGIFMDVGVRGVVSLESCEVYWGNEGEIGDA